MSVCLSVDGHGNHSCVCTTNTDVQGSLSRGGIAGFCGSFTLNFFWRKCDVFSTAAVPFYIVTSDAPRY